MSLPNKETDQVNEVPGMEVEDDEPQVVFETKPRRRRRKKHLHQNPHRTVPEPPMAAFVILDNEDDSASGDVLELPSSSNSPRASAAQPQVKPEETVVVTDSDDDMLDIPEVIPATNRKGIQDEAILFPDSHGASSDDPMVIESEAEVDTEVLDVTPPEILHAANIRHADELKKSGNDYFQRHEFHKALDMYSKAIGIVPTEAAFYANRSACYMMLKKFKEAQADAKVSTQVDPTFEKGYLRLLRSQLALGDVAGAENVFQTIKSLPSFSTKTDDEQHRLKLLKSILAECRMTKEKKDYRKIVYLCDRALQLAEGDLQTKMLKADALLHLNRILEAQDLCTSVLQVDSKCVEAYYIRSICLYKADNMDKAIQFLRQALQFAPDNSMIVSLFRKMKKIKDIREEATALFQARQYRQAQVKFLECLNLIKEFEFSNPTIESKMSLNLSLLAHNLKQTDEALTYVNRAIELNSSYLKAILHRGTVHSAKEMFDEAVRDFEAAQKLDPGKSPTYRKYISDAKLAARKAKRKDYYKILGVERNASQEDVKKAYKKRCLIHHPDRHAGAAETVQKENERQFKELGQAYEILSDPKKRNRYDAGHDLLDSPDDAGFGQGDFDTASFFNAFFGADGMRGGYQQQRGHGNSYTFRPGGNYHAGF